MSITKRMFRRIAAFALITGIAGGLGGLAAPSPAPSRG